MCGLVWLNKHFAEGQKALRKGAYEGRQLKEDVGWETIHKTYGKLTKMWIFASGDSAQNLLFLELQILLSIKINE